MSILDVRPPRVTDCTTGSGNVTDYSPGWARTGRWCGGRLPGGGFVLEPRDRLADLLYALGWALWTGVVLVVFVQIFPEAMKRHYKRALDAYDAPAGGQPRAGSAQAPEPGDAEYAYLQLTVARLCSPPRRPTGPSRCGPAGR